MPSIIQKFIVKFHIINYFMRGFHFYECGKKYVKHINSSSAVTNILGKKCCAKCKNLRIDCYILAGMEQCYIFRQSLDIT